MMKHFPFSLRIDMEKARQLLLFSLLFAGSLCAQDSNQNSAFISANLGGFITAHEGFANTYDSKFGFAPEVSLGLPLSTRLYLFGKATYFAKTGVPLITTYSIDTSGTVTIISQRKEGTAKFHQWLFNLGLFYDIPLSENYLLAVEAGGTMTTFGENIEYHDYMGELTSEESGGGGFLGFFAGLSLERNFGDSPFSVFAEAQYNFSRSDPLSLIGKYGGTNLSLGAKYYFGDRRKK
jgi:hypothetical protein